MNESSPVPLSVVEDLLPLSGAPRLARKLITDAFARWDLLRVVDPACLIISELTSNVVDHAHTIMTLRVTVCGSSVYLSVQDGSQSPPILRRTMNPSTGRGRGLHLVQAFSSAWGYRVDDSGKTVWATVKAVSSGA